MDLDNVSLRGEISNLNNPEFTLLNTIVDATDSNIIKLGTGSIDVDTFFVEMQNGGQIDIKNATYDVNTGTVSHGLITIRKANAQNKQPATKEIIGSGIFGAFVTATKTATADQLYVSGFDN